MGFISKKARLNIVEKQFEGNHLLHKSLKNNDNKTGNH